MGHSSVDAFEADYAAGVLRADPAPAQPADTAEGVPTREFALAGCVLTSDRALRRGEVVPSVVELRGGDPVSELSQRVVAATSGGAVEMVV